MSAVIMEGAPVRDALSITQKERAERLTALGHTPCLAAVLAGDDPASQVYVRNKKRACERLGIRALERRLPGDVTQEDLEKELDALGKDPEVDGILLQLPLPRHLDARRAFLHIPPDKDADGLTAAQAGTLIAGGEGVRPCTPRGIIKMLDFYGVPLKGKNAVVIGRSAIVGKPMAMMLLERDCTVTVCHSRTRDLKKMTLEAEILVAAVGKPRFVTEDMVAPGAAVVDVGINRTPDGLMGDVDFASVAPKASFITPVPGGVGLLTVAMLMENCLDLAERKLG